MTIARFRNDSAATIYLDDYGHQKIVVAEVVTMTDEAQKTKFGESVQLDTLLSTGDIVYIDDLGADRNYADAARILDGVRDAVPSGGASYDLLCTDPSGSIVWSAGSVLIKEEGTLVNSIPFNTLNFVGSSITATDATGRQIDITVAAGFPPVDRQLASSTTQTSTTSTTYIDLDSCTLTTKDLGENGTYVISFTSSNIAADSNTEANFILNIGGSDVVSTEITSYTSKSKYETIALTHLATGIANGTVIKVRYKRAAGTLKVDERSLVIDGVKDSSIVV